MRRSFTLTALAATVALAACGDRLDITNPNSPSVEGAAANPRDATSRQIVGVIGTFRGNLPGAYNGLGSYGRETYNMTPQDGRSVTGYYRDWRQVNSFGAGLNWGARYGNLRNIYEAKKLVTSTTALTATEKAGALGVLKTFEAVELYYVIISRPDIGAVAELTDNPNEVLPIVGRNEILARIVSLLDEAFTDLGTAGTSFYFPVALTYQGTAALANPVASFSAFNRAFKARVANLQGSLGIAGGYAAAQAALAQVPWFSTSANYSAGVYVPFSTAAGDVLNGISFQSNTNLYTHPQIYTGRSADLRYRAKIADGTIRTDCVTAAPRTLVGVTSDYRPCTYPTQVTPLPVIRNEELALIAAEAAGYPAGVATLTTVRTTSGGANAATVFPAPASQAQFIDELLVQRELSLFQEGHRWNDYRRFGFLARLASTAQDVAQGFTAASSSTLPQQECDSRARAGNPGGTPMGCAGGAAIPGAP